MTPHKSRRRSLKRNCLQCGEAFAAAITEINRGAAKFCSQVCCKAFRRPLPERFWSKVKKTVGCWTWTAATSEFGYGRIDTDDGLKSAHRVSWEMHVGPIPEGCSVLHSCDNPPCVRPDHLFLGTLKENTQDMLRKKRHLVKLSDEQQREICSLYATENATYAELGRRFGVCKATTWKILAGKYSPGLVKAPKN